MWILSFQQDIAFPDKDLSHMIQDMAPEYFIMLNGMNLEPTCASVQFMFTALLPKSSDLCETHFVRSLRGICGCPVIEDACSETLCMAQGGRSPLLGRKLGVIFWWYGLEILPTCEEAMGISEQ